MVGCTLQFKELYSKVSKDICVVLYFCKIKAFLSIFSRCTGSTSNLTVLVVFHSNMCLITKTLIAHCFLLGVPSTGGLFLLTRDFLVLWYFGGVSKDLTLESSLQRTGILQD